MGNGITIKDVAKASGVSLATVSRVINGTDMVSKATKEKVMEAVRNLGYNPNNAARALVSQKTNAIGIVVHNLHDPFFYDLIKGFEAGAQQTRYNVIFCSVLGSDIKSKEKYLKYLTNGVVDGVILYGSYLTDESVMRYLKDRDSMKYVMIENDIPDFQCNKLLIDNTGGAQSAIKYLTNKGHRSIAHICGNPNKKVTIDRLNGYLNGLRLAGLEIQDGYIGHTSTDYKSGYERMREMMELQDRPSAVFCSDDAIASYAVRAALDLGMRVPEDVSVIGFDNQTILPDCYRGPQITSVEQPLYQIGYDSVALLSGQLEDRNAAMNIRKTYETRIVEKETVGFRLLGDS